MIPRTVGRYELLEEIGRGGMATVYLARQTDLDRHVALKELTAPRGSDETFAKRFLREARLAGSLSHPNIITVYEYFEADQTPFISMEYIERGSLRPFVGHMSLAQKAGVLEALLDALKYAERRDIVHRDLKPENVMVTDEGGVKVSDFGIARALNEVGQESLALTATGTAIGTPGYMAPEQILAEEIGPWTDLYSIGIMAWEFLIGKLPFSDSTTPMSMLVRHASEAIPLPATIDPTIDAELSKWVEDLTQKNPHNRAMNAQAARDRLDQIIARLLEPNWHRDAPLLNPASAPGLDTADPEYQTFQPRRPHPRPTPDPPQKTETDPKLGEKPWPTPAPVQPSNPEQQPAIEPPIPVPFDGPPKPVIEPDEDESRPPAGILSTVLGLGGIALLLLALRVPYEGADPRDIYISIFSFYFGRLITPVAIALGVALLLLIRSIDRSFRRGALCTAGAFGSVYYSQYIFLPAGLPREWTAQILGILGGILIVIAGLKVSES